MNKQPVYYMQTDPRWAKIPYQVPGETTDIAESGCGPTCAAMLISTLSDPTFTPDKACKWSVDHGYKALGNGTYYSYFPPQFEAFGIKCWQLSWTKGNGNPNHKVHKQAFEYLKNGYYLIALMTRGTWTYSGHFVVVWWEDNKIHINDPASKSPNRILGDPTTFKNEAVYYWVIDARDYNKPKEEEDMTQEKFNEMFNIAMDSYRRSLQDNDASDWSKEARKFCIDNGIFEGADSNFMWEDMLTREQCAQVVYNIFVERLGMDSLPPNY